LAWFKDKEGQNTVRIWWWQSRGFFIMNKRRRLEQLAIASLTEEAHPDVELLAAYALGMLTGTEQLGVAAHVRTCPICTYDLELCRPPEARPRPLIARLTPLVPADGRRSGANQAYVRQYVAADIVIDLTIPPPEGDYWIITGQITQAGMGLAQRTMTLRAGQRRYQHMSDTNGFFVFTDVPSGRYTISATDGQIQVQIRDIVLSLDMT
jgi:hypothetical protein